MAQAEQSASDAFWNTQPCGGFDTFEERARVRYRRDPWMTPVLAEVARHASIVEVGCGQATDALTMCRTMPKGGTYRALDSSIDSLASARRALDEIEPSLSVIPTFDRADATALPIENDSTGCVYSCGVIHHVDDTEACVAEFRRILRPGGQCVVAIYRTASPKVFGAHILRAGQAVLDRLTGRERSVLRLLERARMDMLDGTTMVRECFGVPILKSYTEAQVRKLFSAFRIERIEPHGYVWVVFARKG